MLRALRANVEATHRLDIRLANKSLIRNRVGDDAESMSAVQRTNISAYDCCALCCTNFTLQLNRLVAWVQLARLGVQRAADVQARLQRSRQKHAVRMWRHHTSTQLSLQMVSTTTVCTFSSLDLQLIRLPLARSPRCRPFDTSSPFSSVCSAFRSGERSGCGVVKQRSRFDVDSAS